jgi:uncharacterized protein
MKKKTQIIGQLIRQNVSKLDDQAEVILYGSRARGEERSESDWDVLVLTNYPVDHKKEREFRDNLFDLELETGEPFSLFVYSKSDWFTKQKSTPFFYNVLQEGIAL